MSPCQARYRVNASTEQGGCKASGYSLRERNPNDLALVWPIFRHLAQIRANGIHTHVIPFCRVALTAAQNVIEKTFLPMWLLNSNPEQCFAEHCPQRLDPVGQRHPSCRKRSKQMDVIRHDDIPANSNIPVLCFGAKETKCFMHFGLRQKVLTSMRVERAEVERPNSNQISGRAS